MISFSPGPSPLQQGAFILQSRIIYVTHSQKGALAEKVLRLDSADADSGWHSLFAPDAKLTERPSKLLTGAHAIYSFLSPTPAWTANVRRLNPSAKLVALQSPTSQPFTGHATEWIVEQLKDHPIERAATEQILRSIADRGIGFNRAGGSDVVIHPGSGSPAKSWPLENFISLAQRLNQSGRKVRFIIGEVEQERWSSKEFNAISAVADLRRPQTYLDLLNELSTAAVFIGNDSGPGHLAGIIGTPTLSIFGSTHSAQCETAGAEGSGDSGRIDCSGDGGADI